VEAANIVDGLYVLTRAMHHLAKAIEGMNAAVMRGGSGEQQGKD
jgi:hypothetical protein